MERISWINIEANVLLIRRVRTLSLTGWSCCVYTALLPLLGQPIKSEGNTAAPLSSSSLARRDQRWTRNIRAPSRAAYRSAAIVSRSACVFHLNIVSGDSRQLSLVTFPLRKTLCLTLLTSPYGGFSLNVLAERKTSAAVEDLNWQKNSAGRPSLLTTPPPTGMENTRRSQPSGTLTKYIFGVHLHFIWFFSSLGYWPRWCLFNIQFKKKGGKKQKISPQSCTTAIHQHLWILEFCLKHWLYHLLI